MTPCDDTSSSARAFDPEVVRGKYAEERAKRMTEDRGVLYDLRADERFRDYTKDPFTPFVARDPITEDVDVAIIGAGMSGVTVGAKLRDQAPGATTARSCPRARRRASTSRVIPRCSTRAAARTAVGTAAKGDFEGFDLELNAPAARKDGS